MFLHYLTLRKNWNTTLTRWSIDTWGRIPQGIIDKVIDQWRTRLRACVKAKGRHFEHLLWSRHTTEPLTLLRRRQHKFFCVTLLLSSAKFHCNKLTTVQDIQDYASLTFWHTLLYTATCRENKKYVLSNSKSVQCNFFIFDHVSFTSSKSATVYKISWKSDDFSLRYNDKSIFKMAAVCHLGIVLPPYETTHEVCCWPQLPVKFHQSDTQIWR